MNVGKVRYCVQFWRRHFGNADWYQELEDKACESLDGRVFDVRAFDPASSLLTISCRIRALQKGEVRMNGRPFAARTHRCIEFALEEYDARLVREQIEKSDGSPVELEEFEQLLPYALGAGTERFSQIILFLVNLTFAGVLGTDCSQTYVGSRRLGSDVMRVTGIDRSADDYPFLKRGISAKLDLEEVLAWSRKCQGIWDGHAVSRIEKAVSFLSHTFVGGSADSDMGLLLWSTAGLEALVCENRQDIGVALRKRLPLICGQIEFRTLRQQIYDAYDFRSQLVHGDIPLMNRFNEDEINWAPDRYDAKAYRYGRIQQLLLISAIWKCIRTNATALSFDDQGKPLLS